MIGNESVIKNFVKRDLISSHTCRRTFITLNIKSLVDYSTIVKMTGHTSIATLNKYVEKSLDIEKIKNIDI
jgi:integrase